VNQQQITISIQSYDPRVNRSEVNLKIGEVIQVGGIGVVVEDVKYHLNRFGWVCTIIGRFGQEGE
jgi:hypothetical protein